MTLEVVVLDVDDTLYLERDYVRSGFEAVGVHLERVAGVSGLAAAAWDEFERGARGDVLDRALERLGAAGVRPVAELVAIYRAHAPAIELLADAARFLGRVRAARLRTAVITDGPAVSQRRKLAALVPDLAPDDPAVVVTDELGPGLGKPAHEAFRAVERATGCVGERLVYVADNPHKDFIAPRGLGWRTVRIRRPDGLHAGVDSGDDVDVEVPDLDAAAAVLLAGQDGGRR